MEEKKVNGTLKKRWDDKNVDEDVATNQTEIEERERVKKYEKKYKIDWHREIDRYSEW